MNENLPPPHWSPTGNSGIWYWDEDETIACWKWADDEQPLELPATKKRRRNWYEKLSLSPLRGLLKKFKKTER